VRRRRVSSDNKIELIQKALINLRPFLVLMKLVDLIKTRWDLKRLGLVEEMNQQAYLERLNAELFSKGNLSDVIGECDEVIKDYKDRILKIGSVEEFLQDMGLSEVIKREHGGVEQFVLSHF
jgi:hypothetical protein